MFIFCSRRMETGACGTSWSDRSRIVGPYHNCSSTSIRRYHVAFDYDGSDRNYDMRSIRLRYDYDPTTTYGARLLPFDAIRREQKMNMSIFRRSRVVVVSQSNRNCDIGFRSNSSRNSVRAQVAVGTTLDLDWKRYARKNTKWLQAARSSQGPAGCLCRTATDNRKG